jgi:hypothetical protein
VLVEVANSEAEHLLRGLLAAELAAVASDLTQLRID